jgi:hypothetical protein
MSKLSKQGVRILDTPKNARKRTEQDTCFHDYRHAKGCLGCWARDFRGIESVPCEEICPKCGRSK